MVATPRAGSPNRSQHANLLLDYPDLLPPAIAACTDDPEPRVGSGPFSPGFHLPEAGDDVREFFSAATARWQELGHYQDHRVTLLDLTGNPGTQTTKTFASLLIVARAVEYIRRSGESVMIFSPTSANKGTALRDAVLRALDAGLAEPEQLRVATVAPRGCLPKLRGSRLSTDPELRALNPVLVYPGAEPEGVKAIGREFADRDADRLFAEQGCRLWFSLELANYLVADTARAFFEQAVDPIRADGPQRLHAHAVSSAFGLLGYHKGLDVLESVGRFDPALRPASLLVQHLGTPDMVLNLRHGDFDRASLPAYTMDGGLYRQDSDLRFPQTTFDPDEVLDPTFYTHSPATSPAMNAIIKGHGGDGIVVSLHECLERYPFVRQWLAPTGRPLPADPRTLREWSLTMALTGVLNAVDRDLVDPGRDLVVHGSGSYTTADYEPLAADAVTEVRDAGDIAAALLGSR
ncbi:hypothetical protein ABH935_002571 [Catenulispora sp. GAS73]|uniref:DUF6002 family protein n=1 Tax=Catenulispora sp. GAS73 TaxID=3156269 RepID=UPI0035198C4D